MSNVGYLIDPTASFHVSDLSLLSPHSGIRVLEREKKAGPPYAHQQTQSESAVIEQLIVSARAEGSE